MSSDGARSGGLHPLVAEAAVGRLPRWASVRPARREHMRRVADLLEDWARAEGLEPEERHRRRALGFLHDCLKDVPEEELRKQLEPPFSDLPGGLLHGPAAAVRLAREGIDDTEILDAVCHHTLGHPKLGPAGLALYAADFLEPGRHLRNAWRTELRARMPGDRDAVVREILGARIIHLVEAQRPLHPHTVEFWNAMTGGDPWARASEV